MCTFLYVTNIDVGKIAELIVIYPLYPINNILKFFNGFLKDCEALSEF